MRKKCFWVIISAVFVIGVYFPTRHARHYDSITAENIPKLLLYSETQKTDPNLKACNYTEILLNNIEIDVNFSWKGVFTRPQPGGAYAPKTCQATLKSAVIVPYRERREQLRTFLNYMHGFLQAQKIVYRIIVVEQRNLLPFNRAKMLNYGAKVAIDMGFPCLILHDVDLLPLSSGNLYACVQTPRHMSSSLDTFRFNLPYLTLFGGAVAISSKQYQAVNGMSNLFSGWGGEDDEFFLYKSWHVQAVTY